MSDLDFGEKERAERQPRWRLAGIIFFSFLALIVLYATVMIIYPFLSAIVLGAILVTITFPLYARLRNRFHGRGGLAAMLMLIGITFLIIIPTVVLGFLLVEQANGLIAHLKSGDAQRLVQRMDIIGHLQWLHRFGVDPATLNPQRLILPVMQQIPGWVASNGPAVIGSMAGAVLAFALVLLSRVLFLRRRREHHRTARDPVAAAGAIRPRVRHEVQGRRRRDVPRPGDDLAGARDRHRDRFGDRASAGRDFVGLRGDDPLFVADGRCRGGVGAGRDLPLHRCIDGRPRILGRDFPDAVGHPRRLHHRQCRAAVGDARKAQLPAIPLLFAVIGGMQAFGFIGLVIGPLVFSLLMSIIDIYKRSFGLRESESDVA